MRKEYILKPGKKKKKKKELDIRVAHESREVEDYYVETQIFQF